MSWYWDREDIERHDAHRLREPVLEADPQVVLTFPKSDPAAMGAALASCRIEGWPAIVTDRGDESTLSIPEIRTVWLIGRLRRRGIHPSKISVRAADVLPAQIEGIRQAIGAGTTLEIIG